MDPRRSAAIGPGRAVAAVAVGLCLACGGLGPGSGTRVVVVRAGQIDPETDAAVAEGVAERLRERGFLASAHPEAVTGDDVLHEARKAASAAGAANAVLLELSTREARPGVQEGTALHLVEVDVGVVNLDAEHPVDPHHFVFGREATGPLDVVRQARSHWVDASTGVALRQLYTTPEVASVVMAEDVPLEEMSAANDIRKRERDVAKATERAHEYRQFCEREAAALREVAEAEGLTCTGDPCGGASILGTYGSEVILQHADRTLLFNVPARDHASWSEPPERITALDPMTGAQRELVLAQNLYGLGKVVPGATVGTADWFSADGRDAIVGFDLADGRQRALALLGPKQGSAWSAVAPDGSVVAYCVEGTGDCFLGDAPIDVRRGDWVADGPTLVVQGGDEVLRTFTSSGEELGWSAVKWELRQVIGADDGRLFAVGLQGGRCHLVTFSANLTGKIELTEMPECLGHARRLPDGRLVGESGGRIALWTPGEDVVAELTDGAFRDELPFVLGDDQIVFNRRLERVPRAYDTEIYRRVVCTAPIP